MLLQFAGMVTIEPAQLEVNFGDPIQLVCQINETMPSVNWTLTVNNVTNTLFPGGENVNVSTQQMSSSTISVLTIAYASQYWEGQCYRILKFKHTKDLRQGFGTRGCGVYSHM